jgi:hypothetical protein
MTFVQLATEMEDLGLVPASEACDRAQAHANEFRVTVWVRDEFTDEPLYSLKPAHRLIRLRRRATAFS